MKKCTIKFPHLGSLKVVVYANCKAPKLFNLEGFEYARGAMIEDRDGSTINIWLEKFDKKHPYYLGVIAHEM